MSFKLKMACTATLLAMGVSAHAAGELGKTTITTPAADNGKQRVIVKFKPGHGKSAKSMAMKAGGTLKVDLKQHNAFAVEVSENALQGLRNNPNVLYVEPDLKRELLSTNLDTTEVEPWGISRVEADIVSDANAGNRTVCIIDSGYDINNSDLASNNVTGTNDSGTGNWYEPGGSHGTHVAGTVAAVTNGSGVVGVMPNGNINLHIIKVFNESGWGYSSDLINAVDDCVANGANVVSMSLGGSGSSTTEGNAFSNHYDNGVLSIAASGNDGNSSYSYPASYDNVVSVGAVDSGNQHANFSQYTDQVELVGPGEAILSSVGIGDGYLGQLEVGGVDYFDNGVVPQNFYNSSLSFDNAANTGSASGTLGVCTTSGTTYSCPSMTGKVCLVERGENQADDTSSTENNYPEYRAVNACMDAGAEGVVVYSNAARPGLQHPFLIDFDSKIGSTPVVSVDRATGLELANKAGQSVTMAKQGGQDWEYYNGTSMATPHVSAVAALVWSYHPSCTAAEIRQVLKDTAQDLDVAGRDDRTGFGLVKTQAAINSLDANGCAGGSNPPPSGDNELTKGVAETNLSGAQGSEVFYTFEVPAGATDLNFDISGGSGDADLYVQYGSQPTTSSYDCRPYVGGNTENCNFASPQAGTWHVMIRGYQAYSGLDLVADYTDGGSTPINDTLSESNLSGAKSSTQFFTLEVPAGRSTVDIVMSGGSGDADLYVKFGSQPTTSSYDCRPYKYGNNETCTLNAQEGTYHIMIRGYSSYSGVSLEGSSN
ncbi:S8 family serine peptidase [Kangiella sediminilitoris]|uniref:Peptidase S8 and S53 subtilisin kexin sedolisin n=1 Tax=Kangiella sediminilitoris TaxID=1144748 RepID=A0A1B3B7T1_9GAMM|nr:S8 family serine peptidase [Kangiella sediminilitoris]AOE48849.1 Peptidase S8 and S53 subtilisin kexin sedolisin [Kangiella sediminilitoris]